MAEFEYEIDTDDVTEYRKLVDAQKKAEDQLIEFQLYLEQKYLWGNDANGNCFIDEESGILYFFE